MDRTNCRAAALVLTLALVACNREKAEPTSETTTTSAELETVDRSGVTVPMGPVLKTSEQPSGADSRDEAPRYLGEVEDFSAFPGAPAPTTAGAIRARSTNPVPAPLNPAAAPPDMSNVGPGHIWYVPGGDKAKAKGTGQPNSAGSHDIGSPH